MEQVGALISFLGVTLIARPTAFFRHTAPQAPSADATGDTGPGKHTQGGAHSYDAVSSHQRLIAVCVGLVGVLGSAMAFTTMRWIGKKAHPLLSVNYFSVCCCLVAALAMTVIPSIDFLLPPGWERVGIFDFPRSVRFHNAVFAISRTSARKEQPSD